MCQTELNNDKGGALPSDSSHQTTLIGEPACKHSLCAEESLFALVETVG